MYSTGTANPPLYDLGDTLILKGSNTSTSNPSTGFYYYYSEYEDTSSDYASVSESYSYNSSGNGTDYSEYFSYSADDGVTVDYISKGYTDYVYDSAGRVEGTYSLSLYEYDYGSSNNGSGSYSFEETYTYAGSQGYELLQSTSAYSGTYTYNGSASSYSSTTVSNYGYSSTPTSTYDYDQKRDVTQYDSDGDGITDYTNYSLYTNTADGSSNVYVSVDSQSGIVDYSSDYEYSSVSNNKGGYTSTSSSSSANDWDDDGVINSNSEYSSEYVYDSSYNLVSSSYDSVYKSDYDQDGKADYVSITKESRTSTSGKRLELIWEDNSNGPATLSIGIDKDTNGDYTYDSARGFTIGFGAPPASWTAMGGHVATIDDTLIV